MADIPERDRKWLAQVSPIALDRFCEKALSEAAKLAGAPNARNHERYLRLRKLLRKRDRELAAAFDDHRRSTAINKIAEIRALGLFTEEEFAGFSEETRKRVAFFESR